DVYGLGPVLYRLVAGRPPFQGATPTDVILQVVADDPVPPSRLNAAVPRDLETIVLKCLDKEPAKRYPTANDLADDLTRRLDGEPIVARPVGRVERGVKWVKRNRAVSALLAAVAFSLLGGTAVSYAKYRDAEEQARIARAKEQLANDRAYELDARKKELTH